MSDSLPHVLSKIHVITILGGGNVFFFFLGGGPRGSPGSAFELPRPHDDFDDDDDDDDDVGVDVNVDVDVVDGDDQRCGPHVATPGRRMAWIIRRPRPPCAPSSWSRMRPPR